MARRTLSPPTACIVVDHLDERHQRLLGATLNRLAENGTWDPEALSIELRELEALDLDLTVTGFDSHQLDLLLLDEEGVDALDEGEDDVGQAEQITSQPGDLWLLGAHRLLCGDATNCDSFVRLMDGAKARMVSTDPPYNIAIPGNVSGLGKVKHGNFLVGCGEMSPEGFVKATRQGRTRASSSGLTSISEVNQKQVQKRAG